MRWTSIGISGCGGFQSIKTFSTLSRANEPSSHKDPTIHNGGWAGAATTNTDDDDGQRELIEGSGHGMVLEQSRTRMSSARRIRQLPFSCGQVKHPPAERLLVAGRDSQVVF